MQKITFMHNTKTEYHNILKECRAIFIKKMQDYGSSWRVLRMESLTDQIYIKAQRIRSLQKNPTQKIKEGQEIEFIGIANYSIIALIQLKKGTVDQPDVDTKEATLLFDEQSQKVYDLMLKKNYDYGEAWRNMRVNSITDLILQKLLRIKQIEKNEGKVTISEGVDTNYQDIINYAIFAMIHLETEKKGLKKTF